MEKITTRAEVATNIENQIKENKKVVGSGIWAIGRLLKEFQANDFYIDLGYSSFTEWLSSPDIDFAPRTAFMFMDLHATYIDKFEYTEAELADIDYSKLHRILPIIRDEKKEVVDEWVNKARALRRVDLTRELRSLQLSNKLIDATKDGVTVKGVEGVSAILLNSEPLSALEGLDDESVDVVITQPPAPDEKAIQAMMKEMSPEVQISMQALVSSYHIKWLTQVNRLLKPNGSLFIIGNYQTIFPIANAMQTVGFNIIRDIIWTHSNKKPTAITTLIESHNTIVWAHKGTGYTNNIPDFMKDVWDFDFKLDTDHPREMPKQLIQELITIGTDEDDVILDPFAGAGVVPATAKRLKRKYVAIEQDTYWFGIMTTRLNDV